MLNQILQTLGHKPTAINTKQNSTTYRSPWNTDEKTPSCFVFPNRNWNGQDPLKEFNYKDNSSTHGGDIYNFIMNYFNVSFVDAKRKIAELTGTNYQEHSRPTQKKLATALNEKQKQTPSSSFNQPKESYEIVKTQSLKNKALIDYLYFERGISQKIAEKYVSEIYYKIGNKNYFAISFLNDIGGRELRNKYKKMALGEKYFSMILPNPKDKRLKIFEGFMDFLSYLEINKNAPLSNYLVLNSTNNSNKALKRIQGNFEAYELYLDNDRAGNEATKFFIKELANVIDKRIHYKEHGDLNDFLLSMRASKTS